MMMMPLALCGPLLAARPMPELCTHVAIERRSTCKRVAYERREPPMRHDAADLFCGQLLAIGLTPGLQTCFGVATANGCALVVYLSQRRSHLHAQMI